MVWNTEWSNIQINWNGTDIEIYNNTLWNGEKVMGAWHKEGTSFTNVKVWNNLGSNGEWEPQSDKQNNLVVDAGVFVDEANGNFNLKSGSSPIDQGREIFNITDGFIGNAPDVGAYEYGGDNWIAGITWEPLYGPALLGCYGLPGEECVNLPSDDQDLDGVADGFDLCPDTPFGTTVDTDGCPFFSLASNNFLVLSTGETCSSSNNGTVSITSKETAYTFVAKIEEINTEKTFTSNTVFDNLPADNYTICITTTADADYKQCFNVTITEPEDLSVFSKIDNTNQSVTLNLKGSSLYRIVLNDVLTITDQSSITLDLNSGENNLKVTTNKDCQGQYSESIMIFDKTKIFPTIVDNKFTIAFPDSQKQVINYQILSITGQVMLQKNLNSPGKKFDVDVQNLTSGMYFVYVNAANVNFQAKIIKR